jgi:hypothetical protein
MEIQSVDNVVKHDLGNFIEVGGFRIRKELIVCYHIVEEMKDDVFGRKFGVGIRLSVGPGIGIPIETREESEKLVAKLDWIFMKDKNGK